MRWMWLVVGLAGCNVLNGGADGAMEGDEPVFDARADDMRSRERDARGEDMREREADARRDDDGVIRVVVTPVGPRRPGFAGRYFEVQFEAEGDLTLGGAPDGLTTFPPLAGACMDDRLFVAFPPADFPEVPDFDLDLFRGRLEGLLRPAWFRTEPSPDRAQRDRPYLEASPAGRCHVVAAVRTVLGALDLDAARTGRSCTHRGQLVDEIYSGSLVNWHLRRMDPTVARDATALDALPDDAAVDVVLFDTGWTDRAADELRLTVRPQGVEAPADDVTRHGALVGGLVRQVLPHTAGVRLAGYRVMDENGRGTPIDLARALDHALDAVDPQRPTVFVMALGWPAGLALPRAVRTDGPGEWACESVEDGVGEAVRHLLLEAAANPKLGVFASAGNRPGRVEPSPLAAYGAGEDPFTDRCLRDLPRGGTWFFPAEWGFTPADCVREGGTVSDRVLPVIPVSGTDWRDMPARATANLNGDTFLQAPGEGIAVRVPGEDRWTQISGSSAAVALVGAAVGRLAALSDGIAPMRSVTQLLWATGARLVDGEDPRSGGEGFYSASARRADLCQAESALLCGHPDCGPSERVLGCLMERVAGASDFAFLDTALGDTPAGCGACLAACRADARTCPAPDLETMPQPADGALDALGRCFDGGDECPLDEGTAVDAAEDAVQAIDPAQVGDDPLPFEVGDDGVVLNDGYALGGTGPQPFNPPCPDCVARLIANDYTELHARLDEKVVGDDAAMSMLQAWVVVEPHDDQQITQYAEVVDIETWEADKYYLVSKLLFESNDLALLLKKSDVYLQSVMAIESGPGKGGTYFDETPLIVKLP